MRRLLLALAFLLAPLTAHAQSYHWQTIGWWDIEYFPDANGCAAYAEYEDGVVFVIGIDTTYRELMMQVAVLHPNWTSIVDGRDYEVTVRFDRGSPWYLDTDGARLNGLYGFSHLSPALDDSAGSFVDQFMGAYTMEWSYNNQSLGSFSLKNSRRAMDSAIECTVRYAG